MSSNEKVFKLIEKFVVLAEQEAPTNMKYQAQREKLAQFYDYFTGNLRAITNELGGDIVVLRERKFNSKMLKMMSDVYQDLIELGKSISSEKPYDAAEKLVNYVLNKPTGPVIDNLDFLAKHHLKTTNVDFLEDKMLKHPQIRSLDKLKILSNQLSKFMAENPLILPPSPSGPPSPRIMETMEDIPSFTAGEEDKTRK